MKTTITSALLKACMSQFTAF